MGLSFLALTSSTHAMFSPGHPTEDEPNSPPRRPLVLLSSNADSQQDPFTTPQKQHQAADPEATPRPAGRAQRPCGHRSDSVPQHPQRHDTWARHRTEPGTGWPSRL